MTRDVRAIRGRGELHHRLALFLGLAAKARADLTRRGDGMTPVATTLNLGRIREKIRPEGVQVSGPLEDLVKNPGAGGIGFAKPPTEEQMRTLAEAGFKYDETMGIAWRERQIEDLDLDR